MFSSPPHKNSSPQSESITGPEQHPDPQNEQTPAETTDEEGEATQPRPCLENIGEPFEAFNPQSSIIDPFEGENRRDEEFRERFKAMMLEIIAESQAWADARPAAENKDASTSLVREMEAVAETEREQGRSPSSFSEQIRLQLGNFVANIKNALALLGGNFM
ncbi:hypothetical protein BV25DRAFT_1919580 [Artomyces pyxidatus]|uniref:Uncharacterized protein n=1 Tax=Artomyces pyxidatus TaxID=48021 RepID=A0ACB8SR14_9AGAM|nr:hypothetical protein BV25DRAFT_1919580 [Artomyces pyxidatus]